MFHRATSLVLSLLTLQCGEGEDIPDDLTAACRRLAECGTEMSPLETERECGDRLSAEYDEARTYGCATEHADWVGCLATSRGQCSETDPCQAQQDAWSTCQQQAGEH